MVVCGDIHEQLDDLIGIFNTFVVHGRIPKYENISIKIEDLKIYQDELVISQSHNNNQIFL